MKKANPNRKLLIIVLCVLTSALNSISCIKQSEQKIESQLSNVLEQNDNNVNKNYKPASNLKVPENQSSGIPSVKPSEIIELLRVKKKANPAISAKELAAYANEIIKSKGYDFTFNWEPKGKRNQETLANESSEDYLAFEYEFTTLQGNREKFHLLNNSFAHPCFSVIDIPLTAITYQMITFISDGKEVIVKLPKDFSSEEFVLVDKAKKPIRKWKTPIDAEPVGISEDGKKVYFDSWEFSQDQTDGYKESPINLAVEISENGNLRFIDLKELKSGKGVIIDYDKKFTEIQYEKYKVGDREFIVKFSAPCT